MALLMALLKITQSREITATIRLNGRTFDIASRKGLTFAGDR
jgi:hypothetical protein